MEVVDLINWILVATNILHMLAMQNVADLGVTEFKVHKLFQYEMFG